MFRNYAWLVILGTVCVGCSNAPEGGVQAGAGELEKSGVAGTDAGNEASDQSKTEAKATVAKRTDMAGRWLVAITNFRTGGEMPGVELPSMLVDVNKGDDGKFDAKLKQLNSEFFPPGEIRMGMSEVTADSVHFTCSLKGQTLLDIRGKLADGFVRGSMVYGGNGCDPVRLLPTEAESLQGLEPKALPGAEEFETARKMPSAFAALQEFCKKFPGSPLTLAAYLRLIDKAKEQKLDRAAALALGKEYFQWASQWGSRMELKAHFDFAVILTHRKFLLDDAVATFDEIEKKLADETAARWKPVVLSERTVARTYAAIEKLASASKDAQQKAADELLSLEKADPFNHEVVFALAQYSEKQGQADESLRRYAKLAVVPLAERILQSTWEQDDVKNPLPSESVARLWKEKRGSTAGLEEFLDKAYHDALHSFGDEKVPPRGAGAGNQVALLEFFTGAECPPCVGADVAVSRLEATYAPSELVTLVYQQHIPAPSPLVNEDSEVRLAFYAPNPQERGTPMAVLNGRPIAGVGGPMVAQSSNSYNALREQIGAILAAKSDVRIQLKAQAGGGSIELAADVEGLKETSQSMRLRLALAEDDVLYVGGNGIRHHGMVVRAMPGGSLGVGFNDGKMSFKKTLNLADLKQQLTDYLDAFEQRFEQKFPSKPLELKKLHFVAFVQNDATHEILQAAAIPVSGDLTFTEKASPAKKEPAPKDEATPKESGDKKASPDNPSK